MRFQRLHIQAFGPFTDLELEFPTKEHDLHLFYGENEAGKSSLLRAIRDLLFGIHGQSPDNFLHDYKRLRVLGEVVNRAGTQLIFQRRKGNRNTLLDKDGKPLPDTALLPFLGSVDQSYFSTMFGLGNRELREGARQLLRGEGEIGNALFSASMGGTPIQRVQDSLVEESEQLFKGRATANVSIRPAVKRYTDLLRKSRDSVINPEAWETLERGLAEQDEAKKLLEDAISEGERELGWISRCEDALPSVGRLIEELRLFEALPELPDLASDFVERARKARNAAHETGAKVRALATQVTQLGTQLSNAPTFPQFLAEAEALDVLHQDLGAYRARKESLTNLETKLAGIEPVLRAGMERLELAGELETLETLRLSSAIVLSCEEAAKALRQAVNKRDENSNRAEELQQKIASVESDLKSLPEEDLTPLREALAVGAEATAAHKTLATSISEAETLTRAVADQHALVIGAPKDLDTTAGIAVPAIASIRKFRQRFDQLKREIKGGEDKIHEEGKSIKDLQGELSRLGRRGELPSEEALQKARDHRDHGWQLVLAEWKGEGTKEELIPDSPLENAFPQTIAKADDLADQLRHQAEAVAQAEEKRFRINSSQELMAEAQQRLAGFQRSLKESQVSWEAQWTDCGIAPRSPEEMEEWREAWVEFRETLRRLRTAEATVRAKTDLIQRAKKALAAALGDSPEKDFSVLFEAARSQVQQGEELTGQRKEIAKRLQSNRNQWQLFDQKAAGIQKTVASAEADWKSQCQSVGLPEDASPDSGLHLLQERKELLAKFDQWKELSGESYKTAEAVRLYEERVCEKAAALEVQGDTVETQEVGLWEVLTHARRAQAEHDQLAGQVQRARHELAEATQAETQTVQALEELMRLAKVNTQEGLEQLLANLEKRDASQVRMEGLREILGGLARGQGVDDFITRVQVENADELPQRKAKIESELVEKKASLQVVQASLAMLRAQKEALEIAGDTAADFRQQAESVAAALRQDASRFVRLRLAAYFLRTQIERFREENQGPLLEKSGQVFQRITRGAFDGLGAEFNAQDVPILVGRRADGSNVPVEGMSDGSRDQLYLALRLAALDRYLEEHEPMPLILDDLLITFDDERARAILPQLAELARRTQVFLFTHHDHLVNLYRETLGEEGFNLHRLTNSAFTSAD